LEEPTVTSELNRTVADLFAAKAGIEASARMKANAKNRFMKCLSRASRVLLRERRWKRLHATHGLFQLKNC
jgi:hypothetical protein